MPKKKSMSDRLRQAIQDSEKPLLQIAEDTGVQRASIIRFLRGDQSLRLDKAEILFDYFGLELK